MDLTPLTENIVTALRASHSPQCTKGAVTGRLIIGLGPYGEFVLWDSAQTAGFLCATPDPKVLKALLEMELAQRGAVRSLITGESEILVETPPEPDQETFDFDLDSLTDDLVL